MKEWIKELCPEIADWQAELIAEEAAKKREWVGLTDEEILEVWCIHLNEDDDIEDWRYEINEARAIEAKLKEKNT